MKFRGCRAAKYVLTSWAVVACAQADGEHPNAQGGTGGTTTIVNTAGVGGNLGGYESCVESSSSPDAGPPLVGELGFGYGEAMTRDGRVIGVSADRMMVATSEGNYTFTWRGPALDAAFAVNDDVQIVRRTMSGYFAAPVISTIRSSTATAIAATGAPWTLMHPEPGATATLQSPIAPELPDLVYGFVSCCSTPNSSRCDYSALRATRDGASTPVALGSTGEVGGWSITNVQSVYVSMVELQWYIQVTLLGPATPRSLDGGI